jgi:hypothetical protein
MKKSTQFCSFVFILVFSVNLRADIIDTAVRFWSFDGNYNDSVADIQGTSPGGATFGRDRDGNIRGALVLDGIDDSVFVETSNDLHNFTEFTLSIWFKINAHNPRGRTYLFDTRAPDSTSNSFIFIDKLDDNKESLFAISQTSEHNTLDNRRWQHLLYVNHIADNYGRTYLNGVLVNETNDVGDKNFNGGLTFGSYGLASNTTNYCLNGQLDDIALWGNALSEEEITAVFNAPARSTFVPEPHAWSIFIIGIMALFYSQKRNARAR